MCTKTIQLGIGNIIISFFDKYYTYYGTKDINKKGFTMGRFNFVWIADLVVAYLLEDTQ